MSTAVATPRIVTLADVLRKLGDVPATRIRFEPSPGTATEADILAVYARDQRRCELVDGVLVEKAMGLRESFLAIYLSSMLHAFVHPRKLGIIAGEGGMLKLSSGLVRIPDISFISWDRIPGRIVPAEPIPKLVPNLAIEVLSEGNTLAEMTRKRREYFKAGVSLMWIVDPIARTVAVYTSFKKSIVLTESDTLDGGDVLPGFELSLRELFAELDPQAD